MMFSGEHETSVRSQFGCPRIPASMRRIRVLRHAITSRPVAPSEKKQSLNSPLRSGVTWIVTPGSSSLPPVHSCISGRASRASLAAAAASFGPSPVSSVFGVSQASSAAVRFVGAAAAAGFIVSVSMSLKSGSPMFGWCPGTRPFGWWPSIALFADFLGMS